MLEVVRDDTRASAHSTLPEFAGYGGDGVNLGNVGRCAEAVTAPSARRRRGAQFMPLTDWTTMRRPGAEPCTAVDSSVVLHY